MAIRLVALFALSLFAAPVEYVAHEGGHYLAAKLFGANPTLHFDRVALGAGTRLGPWESLAFTTAGPLVDWAVGIAALLLLVRRYSTLRLLFAIWLARPLQFLPALLGIDLPSFGSGDLRFTDEAVLARAVGLSPEAFIWLEMVVAAPLLAEIVVLMPRPRLAALATLTLGVLAGWAGWLIFGQYVLP
jgi:hypothetical protein